MGVRKCRVCGCTHFTPCIDKRTGEPCHWVEKNLCSACAKKTGSGQSKGKK